MSTQKIGIVLLIISLVSILWIAPARAQGGGWSEPYQLSTAAGKASEATLVADQYGYVHCFWSETLFEGQNTILQYARFDGGTWSAPNDIYITSRGIDNMSAAVDQQGTLHMVWTEGYNGPVYYTYAVVSNALSAQNWAQPLRVGIPAGVVRLQVDSKGVLHILYINRAEELGVYYVHSEDEGKSWSDAVWLDPDIPPEHTPASLNFQLDDKNGLHAVWNYGALGEETPDTGWVRYIHSLDGGNTWSVPYTIDKYIEGSDNNPSFAEPRMIVQGQTVHVIWAGGELPYRHHRFSTDAGRTWSSPAHIFGELHGQAFDGLTVDGAGRVYFFGQIRYPYAIYEAHWEQTRWSKPSVVYLIAEVNSEQAGFGDRVHAHHTHPVVQAGNQLVLTFGDGPADPNRRLFAMNRTLDDIAPIESMPTPTAMLIPPTSPTSTRLETTPTATESIDIEGVNPLEETPKADRALQFGIIPVLLLLGGILVFRFWHKDKP